MTRCWFSEEIPTLPLSDTQAFTVRVVSERVTGHEPGAIRSIDGRAGIVENRDADTLPRSRGEADMRAVELAREALRAGLRADGTWD